MDTNVFISHLKQDDRFHSEAKLISRNMATDEIRAETSVLTLVETASVASRRYNSSKKYREKKSLDDERKIFVIKALRRLASFKITFINIAGESPSLIRSVKANLPELFNEAILLSLLTSLRTFDLMHLAAARYAKQMNPELGAFVTGDGEFLTRKGELSGLIGLPILSPKEYVEALGLKK